MNEFIKEYYNDNNISDTHNIETNNNISNRQRDSNINIANVQRSDGDTKYYGNDKIDILNNAINIIQKQKSELEKKTNRIISFDNI